MQLLLRSRGMRASLFVVHAAGLLATALTQMPTAMEDARARAGMPLYKTIPAAADDELTPEPEGGAAVQTGKDWPRSHGDSSNSRYSPLTQITRENVARLKLAWVYHSNDGSGNVQCNPVIVNGVMYAPTVGNSLVAVNGETGKEIWRFNPQARLVAQRGLIYWPGNAQTRPRILFTAGKFLYSLDAGTGVPVAGFGDAGRVASGGVVAPAIYEDVALVANWNIIQGFDLMTGKQCWRFDVLGNP